jgi:hypothetical protein
LQDQRSDHFCCNEGKDRVFALAEKYDVRKAERQTERPSALQALKEKSNVMMKFEEMRGASMHEQLAKEAAAQMDHMLSNIKQKDVRMQEIRELRMHIINYSKTRDIYTAYRKAGYSRNFFEAHRKEITLHKAAKDAFDQLGLKKIPKVSELNEEFNRLAKQKNADYAQYRTERERMRDRANARRNAEMILRGQLN